MPDRARFGRVVILSGPALMIEGDDAVLAYVVRRLALAIDYERRKGFELPDGVYSLRADLDRLQEELFAQAFAAGDGSTEELRVAAYVSIKQAARMLGRDESSVRRAAKRGRFGAVKHRGQWVLEGDLVRRRALEHFHYQHTGPVVNPPSSRVSHRDPYDGDPGADYEFYE